MNIALRQCAAQIGKSFLYKDSASTENICLSKFNEMT